LPRGRGKFLNRVMNNFNLKKLVMWVVVAVIGLYVLKLTGTMMFARALRGGGSAAKQTLGQLNLLRSSVTVYYGDHEGKYPPSLEALTEERKYLEEIPKAEIYGKEGGEDFEHLHSGGSRQVKAFSSRRDADDTGGWGYVADPNSPEFGDVFINCTHLYMGAGPAKPWNEL
jgi:hypothetical protein